MTSAKTASRTYPVVPLVSVCELNPRRAPRLERADDAPTSFVPMNAVDQLHGTIAERLTRPFREVRKGYTYFENGDIIFAKITPCMQNGKQAVCRDLIDGFGFGSTEFHVLRPSSNLRTEYLHAFLRRPELLEAATQHFTGTVGQQRLPEAYFETLNIPLPPVVEQERIAARLGAALAQVDAARRAAEARVAAAEALPAAYLREVFEGPDVEDWPVCPLAELLNDIEAGTSLVAESRRAEADEVGVLKVSAVSWGEFDPTANKAVPRAYKPADHERVRVGDFLISRCNTAELAGAVVLVRQTPPNLMLSDKTLRLVLKSELCEAAYLEHALRTPQAREFIESRATGTSQSMRNISQETIRLIPVPLPPDAVQRAVVDGLTARTVNAAALLARCRDELAAIEALPASLLREAFGGAE